MEPSHIYKRVSCEYMRLKNINERYREEWRLRNARSYDHAQRETLGCYTCTTSKYNGKEGNDNWIDYKHCHYSSLVKWVKNWRGKERTMDQCTIVFHARSATSSEMGKGSH